MSPTEALSRGPAVWALAAGQMLGFACQFFVFAGLVLFWHEDLGWAKSTLALGPMLALLVGAAFAPLIGKVVDGGRGPELMVFGAMIGVVALVLMSQVQTPVQWALIWMLLGIGQLASQYEVCFAFLIRRLGRDARRAIIRVTLVAGFASTVSIPAYTALAQGQGWRFALMTGAAVMAFCVVPLNWWGTRRIRAGAPPPVAAPTAPIKSGTRSRRLWLLAVMFSLSGLSHWMIAHLLIPVLVGRGYSQELAVFAAAVIGPAQVAGRFALMYSEARISNARATMLTLCAMFVATMFLALSGAGVGLVVAYVLVQGAAIGMTTILRPVLIADMLGAENYGANAGRIQVPSMIINAFAPMIGALLLEGPGFGALVGLSLGLILISVLALHALRST